MAWVKIDDQMPEHEKLVNAGALATAMDFAGICYCNRLLTDGFVTAAQVPKLLNLEGYAFAGRRVTWRSLVEALVRERRWEEVEGGYRIHDYGVYQLPRAQVLAERQTARERMAEARANKRRTRGDVRVNGDGSSGEVLANNRGSSGEVMRKFGGSSDNPVPVPVPVPGREIPSYGPQAPLPSLPVDSTEPEASVLRALAEIRGFPSDEPRENLRTIRELRALWPSVDLPAEIPRFRDYWEHRDKTHPQRAPNWRLRLRNWVQKSNERVSGHGSNRGAGSGEAGHGRFDPSLYESG